jgi:hypothetical protein
MQIDPFMLHLYAALAEKVRRQIPARRLMVGQLSRRFSRFCVSQRSFVAEL